MHNRSKALLVAALSGALDRIYMRAVPNLLNTQKAGQQMVKRLFRKMGKPTQHPHQGARECERRVRQMKASIIGDGAYWHRLAREKNHA